MTDLDPKLTFETFVVGPANRLAAAAARRAAESPGTSYNPLFIYSASGLGKSHILNAVAHQAKKSNAKLRTMYQALEAYVDELADALEAGQREELKDRYRDLDILLMDDVQFLTGQPEAQEMLLSTLDALTASGSQIVLASDRPPAEINGLDARLLSRFSGGLIVDIAAPEYETRVAIIRRKVEERGQTLEPGVAEVLAKYPLGNVRELGGALNRILAIQDLEERQVRPQEIPELMGDEKPEPEGDFDDFLDEIAHDVAETVETQEQPWRKKIRETADDLEREGFRVDRIRGMLEAEDEPGEWEERLEAFRSDVARLREIEEELDRLDNPWPEAAQGVIRDPERLDEAEALLASVQERTRPFPTPSPGPDLADLEASVQSLAVKAAQQLVTTEKPKYNPLFLWSSEPAGTRAILAATARTHLAQGGDATTAVTSVSDFAEDFIRALSAGVAGAWRERWWTVDLLLVYDAQDLSETERAQDEFFHLFEALKRRGSRVMLVADRPPSEIGKIDERLRSRFEGGLVLEVEEAVLPDGAGEVELHAPGDGPEEPPPAFAVGAEGPDMPGERPREEPEPEPSSATIPPLEELDLGDGRGGLFVESGAESPVAADEPGRPQVKDPPLPGAGEKDGRWIPSREKVVWYWPELSDRLVEDLE